MKIMGSSAKGVVEGLDRFPEALGMMFNGTNLGKILVKSADVARVLGRRRASLRTEISLSWR